MSNTITPTVFSSRSVIFRTDSQLACFLAVVSIGVRNVECKVEPAVCHSCLRLRGEGVPPPREPK